MSGITLKEVDPATVITPSSGKDTVFIDNSVVPPTPAYKDSLGVTRALGTTGSTGAAGPIGPPGYAFDGEDAETIVIPGPQGPIGLTGTTGAQGPVGLSLFVEDGLDGEDGVPGVPGVAGSSVSVSVKTATIRLIDAQIKSLSSSPVQIVAAAGTNIVLFPIMLALVKSWAGTYSASFTMALRYAGGTVDITQTVGFTNSTNIQAARGLTTSASSTDNFNPRNTAINIRSSADVTSGNAANYVEATVTYIEMDTTVT